VARLTQVLDTLESFHGEQTPRWPTDPYRFLVWWHSGYPASDERCSRGWQSLSATIGVTPKDLLSATSPALTRALTPGGLVPQLRAARLKEIAARVRQEFDGDLSAALKSLSPTQAHAVLRTFPGIGAPGADRILLFAGISSVAAVPSSCPHVAVRIQSGQEPDSYSETYAEAQQIIAKQVSHEAPARMRAYLLLQYHGRQLCKRANPKCQLCPLTTVCAYFSGVRPTPPAKRPARSPARRPR
jgi:endonuclease III